MAQSYLTVVHHHIAAPWVGATGKSDTSRQIETTTRQHANIPHSRVLANSQPCRHVVVMTGAKIARAPHPTSYCLVVVDHELRLCMVSKTSFCQLPGLFAFPSTTKIDILPVDEMHSLLQSPTHLFAERVERESQPSVIGKKRNMDAPGNNGVAHTLDGRLLCAAGGLLRFRNLVDSWISWNGLSITNSRILCH